MLKKIQSRCSLAHSFIVSLLFILVSVFSLNVFSEQTVANELEPGEVRLTKTATPVPGMVNQWDISLKVEGKDHFPPPPTDVVLILDLSASMTKYRDRLTPLKQSAKDFVYNFLGEGYQNSVTLITFDTNVKVHTISDGAGWESTSVDPAHKTHLMETIGNLAITGGSEGGTNTQGALHEIADILSESDKVNRNVILLSDGMPTYSYKLKSAYLNPKLDFDDSGLFSGLERIYYAKGGRPEEAFDYTNKIGNGGSASTEVLNREAGRQYHQSHARSTIDEASILKNKKVDPSDPTSPLLISNLYTVGIDLTGGTSEEELGRKTLQSIASSEDKYYDAIVDENGVTNFDDILNELLGKMTGAIIEGQVVDPMGEGFKLTDQTNVVTTQGTTSISKGTPETITWDFDSLKTPISDNPKETIKYAEMTYRVEATDDALKAIDEKTGLAPTNGLTTINYLAYDPTNDYKEVTIDDNFVVPKVKPTIVSLEKELIDEFGSVTTTKDEKFKFTFGDDEYTTGDSFELYPTEIVQKIHPWIADKEYKVDEILSESQKYTTTIDINGTKTTGTSAAFKFVYDSTDKSYEHQKIKVTNQKPTDKKNVVLNIRQAVVNPHEELVVPSKGFYSSKMDNGTNSQDMNLISGSTTKNTSIDVNTNLFTSYTIELASENTKINIKDSIPEYYRLYGYVLTTDGTNVPNEHISTNGALKFENDVLLDYKLTQEYWLTMFIEPKFNEKETYPRPYSWSYKVNQFGS